MIIKSRDWPESPRQLHCNWPLIKNNYIKPIGNTCCIPQQKIIIGVFFLLRLLRGKILKEDFSENMSMTKDPQHLSDSWCKSLDCVLTNYIFFIFLRQLHCIIKRFVIKVNHYHPKVLTEAYCALKMPFCPLSEMLMSLNP